MPGGLDARAPLETGDPRSLQQLGANDRPLAAPEPSSLQLPLSSLNTVTWLSLSCLHSRDYSSPLVTMERHLLKGRIYNGLFFSEADGRLQTS